LPWSTRSWACWSWTTTSSTSSTSTQTIKAEGLERRSWIARSASVHRGSNSGLFSRTRTPDGSTNDTASWQWKRPTMTMRSVPPMSATCGARQVLSEGRSPGGVSGGGFGVRGREALG
jgi:hypothetical protein